MKFVMFICLAFLLCLYVLAWDHDTIWRSEEKYSISQELVTHRATSQVTRVTLLQLLSSIL